MGADAENGGNILPIFGPICVSRAMLLVARCFGLDFSRKFCAARPSGFQNISPRHADDSAAQSRNCRARPRDDRPFVRSICAQDRQARFRLRGIRGLVIVLIGTFYLAPARHLEHATGFWSFYTADPLSIFFKRFTLLTTILVLVMMIDYAPSVRQSFAGVTTQSALGEFFALPIFTCAGLCISSRRSISS